MRYFGGKQRIARALVPELQKYIKEGQTFVDAFCGSCNIISKIKADRRIGNDLCEELIALHIAVQQGWIPPSNVSLEEYAEVRVNPEIPKHLKGFIGFGCSFAGKYFGGYARGGEGRNYALNAKNSLLEKHQTMKDVEFLHGSYEDIDIPPNSVVYCDIPYKNTTGYSVGHFNHDLFYEWAEKKSLEGNIVLVSEYGHNVPSGWEVLWEHKSKKDIRNKEGVQDATVEVLMAPRRY